MTVSRRHAREWAVQMLVAADINPQECEDLDGFMAAHWETILDADPEFGADKLKRLRKMRLFTEERVKGVLADLNEIDDALSGLLDHWDVYRLGTVERAVLRLGLWEMRNSDVPTPVVINEAVDIANWFSSSKTRSIINGILDKVAKAKEDSPSEK
jgi:N utilization substance protein B